MVIKEFLVLPLLGIVLRFLVVSSHLNKVLMDVFTLLREGNNSVTLLLSAQVLLPASVAGLLPSIYTCWGR